MELSTYFKYFLKEIRLSENQINTLKTTHNTLRDRLNKNDISEIIVGTFLQGSYARSTAVKPKSGNRSDVDVIIVTNLDTEDEYSSPEDAFKLFHPFLEKYYEDKYEYKNHSIAIKLTNADMDMVITSAPSEVDEKQDNSFSSNFSLDDLNNGEKIKISSKGLLSENEALQWQNDPLNLPDCDNNCWKKTHPIEVLRWTKEKNSNTNGHYVNVVKALKWWKKYNYFDFGHPKSYTLEHLIGDFCPDSIGSVAEGIVSTLKNIVSNYEIYEEKPYSEDRGIPDNNVLDNISDEDYEIFYNQVKDASEIATNALESENKQESIDLWVELFGNIFTKNENVSGNSNSQKGYISPIENSERKSWRFGK